MKKFYALRRWVSCFAWVVLLTGGTFSNAQKLIINEVHGKPATGLAGDANGDGAMSTFQDEFIEFVNVSSDTLDMSGWTVSTAGTGALVLRHTFPASPATILPPGGALVLFGGGAPVGTFGGSIVQVCNGTVSSSSGLIANAGATIVVNNRYGHLAIDPSIVTASFSATSTSFTRNPDVTGPDTDLTVLGGGSHPELPLGNGKFYSPGLHLDGSRFIENTSVRFAAASGSVSEGDGAYDLKVYVVNPTDAPAHTTFEVVMTSADLGDIGSYTVQQSVAPGVYAVNISIPITDDSNTETDKHYTFSIQQVAGGLSAVGDVPSEFTLTIIDNDNDVPVIAFPSAEESVSEAIGVYELHVSMEKPATTAVSAEIRLIGGSGNASDLNGFTVATVNFPAGPATEQVVQIPVDNDAAFEPDENFLFEIQNISGGVAGTLKTFTLTLENNDERAPASLLINEVLPWAAGASAVLTVDANGDGTKSAFTDEMIELVNTQQTDLDISGWKVGDGKSRLTFPAGLILKPGEAIVVFGGWSATAGDPPKVINGARAFFGETPSEGLGLVNTGDQVNVWDSQDHVIDTYVYGQATNGKSFTRIPDITGDFEVHAELEGSYVSPGVKTDGTPFIERTDTEVQFEKLSASLYENNVAGVRVGITIARAAPGVPTSLDIVSSSGELFIDPLQVVFNDETIQYITVKVNDNALIEGDKRYILSIAHVTGGDNAVVGDNASISFLVYDDDVPVIFNEVHVAPASTISGDANRDGTRSASEDQFVELVNVYDREQDGTVDEIDLSGWGLYLENNTLLHKFFKGTRLLPYEAVVVFGGGVPIGKFGGSLYQIASEGGLTLSATSGKIILKDAGGVLKSAFQYGAEANVQQSLTRSPDITGEYTPHASVANASGALFSPGTRTNGGRFGDITTGVQEAQNSAVRFYPNPVAGKASIEVVTPQGRFDYIIMNSNGQVIDQQDNVEGSVAILDFTKASSGVYFYKVSAHATGRILGKGKFIREH